MISKGELETIVNYALKDKETLEMALKVGAAFSEIKISIISDFFYALENALNLDSDEWIIFS